LDGARSWTLLQEPLFLAARNYSKSSPALYPIGLEIVVIDCENQTERFSVGNPDERGVGEVHRPVTVLVHEGVQ
jgi:hypothetical protein